MAQHIRAVGAWHQHVGDYQVERLHVEHVETLITILRRRDRVARALQHGADGPPHTRHVVDQQDIGHTAFFLVLSRRNIDGITPRPSVRAAPVFGRWMQDFRG